MTKLTREDILKLARLARLDLTNDEVEEFSGELSDILRYVEKLQAVDTSNQKPTNQVTGLENVTRTDEVVDYGYDSKTLLENVPATENVEYIKVKRMIN